MRPVFLYALQPFRQCRLLQVPHCLNGYVSSFHILFRLHRESAAQHIAGDDGELVWGLLHIAREPVLQQTDQSADDEGIVAVELLRALLLRDEGPLIQALLTDQLLQTVQETDISVFTDQDADEIAVFHTERIDTLEEAGRVI